MNVALHNEKAPAKALAGVAEALEGLLGGRLAREVPLGPRVGYRVGGPAALLATCHTEAEVQECCARAAAHDVPVFVLGRGSNLLVRDGGVRALVLMLEGDLARLEWLDRFEDGATRLRVGAGMTTGALVRELTKNALGGGEFLALIPGTMGGAVRMNAGAHGGEMSRLLESVRVIVPGGELEERAASGLGLAYRTSNLSPEEIVTSMVLRFGAADADESSKLIREHAEYRRRTQPIGEPNAGSVFKNPAGDYAGRLLEQAGMKGVQVGGAKVSEKHANWIVTSENASAADVEALIEQMQRAVAEKFNVRLELEIKIVGTPGEGR